MFFAITTTTLDIDKMLQHTYIYQSLLYLGVVYYSVYKLLCLSIATRIYLLCLCLWTFYFFLGLIKTGFCFVSQINACKGFVLNQNKIDLLYRNIKK